MKSNRQFRRTLSLAVPAQCEHPDLAAEKWLLSLWQATRKHSWRLWRGHAPVSLELVGAESSVLMQVTVDNPTLAELTTSILHALIPGIDLAPGDRLADLFNPDTHLVSSRFELRRHGSIDFPKDNPEGMRGLLASLSGLSRDQVALVQLLLDPTWIRNEDGSQPAYWLAGRVVVADESPTRAEHIVRLLTGALGQFAGFNGLHFGSPSRLRRRQIEHVIARRWPRRLFPNGHPATTAQVATLFHPPANIANLNRLVIAGSRKTPAPPTTTGIQLGEGRDDLGRTVHIRLPRESLLRHALVIGPSGSGKSTVLSRLAIELACSGRGFTLLDPHGSLAANVAQILPAERLADAALLRFRDADYPIGLNPLRTSRGQELAAADGLVEVLQRVQGRDHWGPLLELTLHHAALAAIELHGTLADASRMIEDPWFRYRALDSVSNEQTVRFFRQIGDADGLDRRLLPAAQRLQRLLAAPWLRNILAQPAGGLDFGEAFDERRILLCDLSGIGVGNAKLLGSLLLLLIRQATLNRATEGAVEHTILIDEASWFLSRTISELLDQARKFGVGLVMAIQRLGQLQPEDVRDAVLANPGSFLSFRVNDRDEATAVAKHLASDLIGAFDLQRLPNYEAYLRVTNDGALREPSWLRTQPPVMPRDGASARTAQLIDAARRRYAQPRALVEAAITAAAHSATEDEEPEIQTLQDAAAALPADAA